MLRMLDLLVFNAGNNCEVDLYPKCMVNFYFLQFLEHYPYLYSLNNNQRKEFKVIRI